jgi:hypothetical protein
VPTKPHSNEPLDPFTDSLAQAAAKATAQIILDLVRPEFLKPAAPKAPAAPPAPPPIAGKSETIDEYCARKQISRATYYKMRRQGLGPREERFGAAVRIPPETVPA